jgi:hypothetical protein
MGIAVTARSVLGLRGTAYIEDGMKFLLTQGIMRVAVPEGFLLMMLLSVLGVVVALVMLVLSFPKFS